VHGSVLQNKKYIKFAYENTVEVLALSRLDEGIQKGDKRAATYSGDDGKEYMVGWPNLTAADISSMCSSKAGSYNNTGKIPFTCIVNPHDEAEMVRFCERIPGPKMANMLEGGVTPVLPPQRLEEIGYRIAAYPLALLDSSVYAMRETLGELAAGRISKRSVDFATIRDIVGFDEHDRLLQRYADPD